MSSTITVEVPKVFRPLLEPARYKGIHGGRASGKSWWAAEHVILQCLGHPGMRVLCAREVQKSLKQSVKKLLEDKIEALNLGRYFEVQESVIKTPGNGIIIFQGLATHTADSIKSLEGIDLCWIEEAQSVSQRSFDLLRPTIRKPNSTIICTWNPSLAKDPVDAFFRRNNFSENEKPDAPPGSICVEANFENNPFLPVGLMDEIEYDKKRDFEKYLHVWKGGYQSRSESRVFHNWVVEEYETPNDARFYYGLDFGFSVDPNAFVRCFFGRFENGKAIADPKGKNLFIDYESYEHGCTIEKTPAMLKKIPHASEWPIRADNARPETIDYLRRNGFPKITSSTKGKNSIVEGVEFIKSFDVVIHPRCKHTQDEFTHYRYEIDKNTDEILPKLQDANCDIIDALRYSLELERKATRQKGQTSFFMPKFLD